MKDDWKYARLAAGALTAALLLSSGALASELAPQAEETPAAETSSPVEEAAQASAAVDIAANTTAAPPEVPAAGKTVTPDESSHEIAVPGETVPELPVLAKVTAAETVPAQETVPADAQPAQPYIQPAAQTEEDWRLLLVNPWNKLPEDDEVELAALSNGLKVDKRIYEDLEAMLSACREAGLRPIVCSAYRTQATQERLYNNKIARLRAAGWTGDALLTEAARWVAPPGTSEHQTGLALDIVAASYQLLDDAQADTAEQQWLMEHCWEYGFILRYPEDKTEITGIGYEPWHYRYVGRETAAAIHESGLCLEEYLRALPAPVEVAEPAAPAAGAPAEAAGESNLAEAAQAEAASVPDAEAGEIPVPAELAPEDTAGEEITLPE